MDGATDILNRFYIKTQNTITRRESLSNGFKPFWLLSPYKKLYLFYICLSLLDAGRPFEGAQTQGWAQPKNWATSGGSSVITGHMWKDHSVNELI